MYQQNNNYHKEANFQQNNSHHQCTGYHPNDENQSGIENDSQNNSAKDFWEILAGIIIVIICARLIMKCDMFSEQSYSSGVSTQEEKSVSDENTGLSEDAITICWHDSMEEEEFSEQSYDSGVGAQEEQSFSNEYTDLSEDAITICSHDSMENEEFSEQSYDSGVGAQEEQSFSNESTDLREDATMSTRVNGKDYSYAHGYYFNFLTAPEQIAYEDMIEALENYNTEAYVTPLTESSWNNVTDALRYDHPEYYWVHKGLSYYRDDDAYIRRIKINVPEDARYILPQLRSYAESVAASVAGRNTYDAYLEIYAIVANMATYGKAEGVDDQTISGIMIDHLGVCAGYADTFKFLCDAAGLPCIVVIGSANGGNHAWNMIMIDGSTYWVDVTWGDGESDYWYSCPNFYTYFCVDDAMFMRSHSVSYTMNRNDENHFSAVYPSCTDTTYTWFNLHDLIFSSYDEAYSYIRETLPQGNLNYWMQFTSQEEMDRMVNSITPDFIGELLQEAGVWYGEYQYSYNYDTMTLVLELQ